jgi:hypothetical protein
MKKGFADLRLDPLGYTREGKAKVSRRRSERKYNSLSSSLQPLRFRSGGDGETRTRYSGLKDRSRDPLYSSPLRKLRAERFELSLSGS